MLKIPPKLEAYVNDYVMNLVEVNKNQLSFRNQQNRNFFRMCELLYDSSMDLKEKKQKVIAYSEEQKVSDEVVMAVTAAAGKVITKKKEGEMLMCTFFDELMKEGQQIGEEIGEKRGEARGEVLGMEKGQAKQIIELGEELGWSLNEILQRLEEKLHLTMAQAKGYIGMYASSNVS